MRAYQIKKGLHTVARVKIMKRYSKTVITKDGYVITRHAIALNPYCRYTIIKPNGSKIGWYTYRQLLDTLAILRLFA